MAAIISGNSLGLSNSSLATLGSQGMLGNAANGRSGESVFVDSVTGNLVLQSRDELLVGRGPDLGLVRTYNSQGLLNDDNGDNWRLGVYKKVAGLTGTVNTAGSTVRRTDGDGAESVYTYSATLGAYVNSDGGGAFDTLSFNATNQVWTFTDGASQVKELYDNANGGRITQMQDTDGNSLTYTYNAAGLITQVTDASGESTFLDYTGTNLTQIRTVMGAVTLTRVRYGYDASNRLSTVTVDLSPADNSVADGNAYVTTYTYDGTSTRVATLTQSDGTRLTFAYVQVGTDFKVASITDALGQVTSFGYTTGVGQTTVNANSAVAPATSFNLVPGALTTPSVAWGTAGLRAGSATTSATGAQVKFNANGDGMAVWALGADLFYSIYTKNNDSWSAAQTLDGTLTGNPGTPNLSMSNNGNALVTWVQNGNVYARRYIGGVWDGASTIPNLENLTAAATNPVGAINDNGRAVVAFVQASGTPNNLYVNVFNGTAWQTAATAVDDIGTANTNSITNTVVPSVAIDPLNNATVLWLQKTGTQTADSLYFSRFNPTTGTWSTPNSTTLENTTTAVTAESIAFDANGNGIAIWLQGGTLLAKSYTASTNAWSASTTLGTSASAANLSLSANGNGLVTWVNANNILARRYAAGAWIGSAAESVESATGAASSPSGSINDAGQAVVAFVQASGTTNNVVANRFTGGAWQSAALIESNSNSVAATMTPKAAIDAQGNVNAVWLQRNGTQTTDSVYSNRFNTSTTPYYTIPSGATWASVATAVYGSSAPASQLQSALGNPPLTAGNRLTGFPATLAVNTYTVQANDTWASIAQVVYGTTAAASALQSATGNPTLTAGLQLAVPASLTLSGGGVTITDALGKVTQVNFDAMGELTGVTAPAVAGVSQTTSYAYNANGDVTQVTDPRGNVVTYTYDANGNRISVRDAAGNTVTSTYGSKNELLTQTSYLVPDPDGAGAGQPGSPLTTRYVYNATNHLRFTVSAEGRVTEYRYNSFGQQVAAIQYTGNLYTLTGLNPTDALSEAQLTTFVDTADKSKTLRVDTSYDFRGQVASATSYAAVDALGNGVVNGTESVRQYVYDQAGNLLSTVDPRGVATPAVPNDFTTSYVYDGLNRVLSSTDALGRVTLTQYDDANRKVVITLANGLVNTSTFDTAGQLVSVLQSANSVALGTTSYFYDADGQLRRTLDPTGISTHILYDEAGRKIATIDGTGSLTEYRYNADNQVARTIRYATAVSAANLASLIGTGGAPTTVTLAAIRPAASGGDRSTWAAYDAAGRLVKSVDELGFVTQSFYDGASRLTDAVRFSAAISTATLSDAPTVASINPTSSTDDRLTRNFYDGEGRLLGTLDGEGFLVEYKYDAAGELIETVGYATVTAAGLRTTGTLAQLRPAANANDIHSFTLYNSKGQVVGTVDGESYLTEYVYDAAGNQTQAIRYATRVSFTPGASIASIRPAANALDQVSATTYTALNQVASQTNFEGTLTSYSYDEVGNLTQTVRAVNTADVRTLNAQYDKQGRLTAQLNGNGSALLTGGLTQAQIDAIWAANAIHYSYDAAGRRTSAIDANGNKTLFYYDADGHLTHSINAAGEVQENRYNVLGQLTQTINYGTRLSAATLATLSGGLVNTTLTSAVSAIANAALDSSSSVSYTLRGQVASTTDPLAFATTRTYNAFGETVASSQQIGSGQTLDHSYAYDKRGLLTQTVWDPSGVNSSASTVYDAFGRAIQSTDANGNLRSQSYDKLGRVLTTTDPTNAVRSSSYDAFGRVLTQVDALGNATTFAYSNANRSVTMTTPEGVVATTVHNREGQTQTITDGRGGSTQYAYDKDGNLTQVTDALGQVSTSIYDKADRLTETVDARGNHIVYTYDAANRVLTRTQDPGTGHLNLVTSYAYDAKGQTISVTDPRGIVTQTQYDLKGEVTRTIVDPTGLNIRTSYAYDGRGKVVTVTEGETSAQPRVTQYTYDKLGRRTREQVDPAGLNLSITYTYDKNNNAVTRTDPLGNLTRYVYDADDRLIYTIDPLGGVSENGYDAEGRLVKTVAYAAPINLTGLSSTPTVAQVQPLVTAIANPAKDALASSVFDRDGRKVYSVSGIGAVIKFVYDANGNVIDRIGYANAIPTTTAATTAAVAAAVALVADAAHDARVRTVYDALNRATFTIDGTGAVTKFVYDASGNVVDRIAYANAVPTSTAATAAALSAAVVNDPVHDSRVRMVYDAANRLVYAVDGLGAVTQNLYDADGNVIESLAYANKIPTATAATAAAIQAALVPDAARDGHTCWTYDTANRMVFSVDALGAVTQNFYDALGHLTERLAYANKVNVALPATAAAVQAALVPDAVRDEATWAVYDAAGRQIYAIDSTGAVTQSVYDAEGHRVSSVAFANLISLSGLGTNPSAATVQGRIVANVALDRVAQQVLDADEHVVYKLDALGYVQKNDYDALGRITRTTRYANAVPASTAATLAGVAAALTPNAAADQVDTFTYDAAGRLAQSTDALGSSESYTYDALSNQRTFTNKKGSVTSYTYDAAGRVLTETGPAVEVDSISPTLVVSAAQASIVTAIQYDALGRVTGRTEALGVSGQERTTHYVYDAAGHQVQTIFPQVSIYNAAADNLATNGTNGTVSVTEMLATLNSTVTYDALGNAVVNRDVAGNFSYKVYDTAGRVRYEVDAEHGVTEYARDAFGNATQVTRYASAVNFGTRDPAAALTIADVQGMLAAVSHVGDRTVTTSYDALNRATQSVQPQAFNYDPDAAAGQQSFTAGASTKNIYDAFGQVVQVQTLKNPITNTWINTVTNYYDRSGNQAASVDALGYLSTMSYDAEGNLTDRKEFAQALAAGTWSTASFTTPAASADDRETRYAYDRDNRKVSETRVNVEFSTVADGTSTRGDVTTTYGYDAVGNLTRTSDALGNSTFTYYDAMGRVTAVVAPQRSDEPDGVAVTPLIVFKLDAYGNVVQRIDYALGAAAGANENAYAIAGASAGDRSSLTRYDAFGHAIQSVDANGHSSFASYDAAGNLAKQWQPITGNDGTVQNTVHIYQYDKLGRQIADIEPSALPNLVQQLQTGARSVQQAFLNWGIGSSSIVGGVASGAANSVSVAWDSLAPLGQGDVLVNLYYVTAPIANGFDESGAPTGFNPGFATSASFGFSAGSALTGATLNWSDGNGISSISEIQVYKKDANGNWALITDRTTPGAYSNHLELPGPVEPGVQVSLQYRASGTANAFQPLAVQHFDGLFADVGGLGTGAWDFLLTYFRQGVAYATQTGSFTTSALAGGTVTLTPSGDSLLAGGFVQRQTSYDTFGEVTAKGINGGFQEYFDYDNAGRLWRTNTGDGVNKVALYDLQGNTTAEIRSKSVDLRAGFTRPDDVAALAGTVRTESRYDALGRKIRQTLPFFVDATTGATITPIVNQTLDRWGNVTSVSDPRSAGWITQYRYNAFNQAIEAIQPDGNGAISAASPDTCMYYNAIGRRIAMRDADGHVNAQRYDGSGDLVEEIHADGGHVRYGYDAFGDRVKMVDAMGNPTAYTYDHVGNMLQAIRAPVAVYSNDSAATFLGTQALTDTYVYDEANRRIRVTNAAGETTRYDYDTRGNVVRITQPLGQSTQSAYDANNNKIAELNANDDHATWTYDYFGKLIGHTDIGSAVYTYGYDFLNHLTTQTNIRNQNPSQNLAYAYDAAGQLTGITDNTLGQQTTFGWDAAGHHVLEVTTQGTGTYQNNHIAYDTLGRIAVVDDGRYHLTFAYDGAGNRTHETIHYVNDSAVAVDHDYWYAYDAMNRETVVEGVNTAGVIGISTAQGHQLAYDLNGNRTSDLYYGATPLQTGTDESGAPIYGTTPGFVTRHYAYDAQNRVTVADQDGLVLDRRDYDAASRLVRSGPDGGAQGLFDVFHEGEQINFYTYDANGRMVRNRATGADNSARFDSSFAYDGMGNTTSHTVSVQNSTPYTNFFNSTYAKFDGTYKEVRMDGSSTRLQPGFTVETYDANGNLTAVNDATDGSNNRTFVNDAFGKILQKNQGAQSRHELIVNGQLMGVSGDSSADDNFSLSYRRIGAAGGLPNQPDSYTVQRGDSLQSIAQSVWGDASLWYLIADANGLAGDKQLQVGQRLVIPARANGASNSADVFRPYDPMRLIGDTQPNLPVPPSGGGGGGCGGFGFIIVLIVTIVVTIITEGATAELLMEELAMEEGTAMVVGAAVGAAAGSIAGQLVGNAIGIQNGFSWKAVAIAALSAGLTQGIATGLEIPMGSTDPAVLAERAAIGTAVSQGVRMVAYPNQHFDWRAVAVSAVAAYAGGVVSNGLADAGFSGNGFGDTFARNFGSGLAKGAVTAVFSGGKVDMLHLVGDAFGNAFGSALGSYLDAPAAQERALRRAYADAANRDDADLGAAMRANARQAYADTVDRQDAELGAAMRANQLQAYGDTLDREDADLGAAMRANMPAEAPQQSAGKQSVRAGDYGGSLERIARDQLGPDATQREINNYVGQLFELNGITNARAIGPEQTIVLPTAATPAATSGLAEYGKDIAFGEQQKLQLAAQRAAESQATANASGAESLAPTIANAMRLGLYDTGTASAWPASFTTPSAWPVSFASQSGTGSTSSGPRMIEVPTYDMANGVPDGGTTLIPDPSAGPQMSYGEQMWHVGQVGLGALEGVVNGVPKAVVGLGTLLVQGSIVQGMSEAGYSPQEALATARQSTEGWWDGTVISYSNPEQKLGGIFGELASPLVWAKAISWGASGINALSRIGSTVEAGSPSQLISGQAAEVEQLAALNSSAKVPFTPTAEQANSAAFRVVVGEPKYTPKGDLVGTIYDGATAEGLAEVKTGSSVLDSSYQLRLQTYGSLVNESPLTIYTNRAINPTFQDYLTRWGVSTKPLPK